MHILPLILFVVAAGYFGFGLLRIVPTLARLLAASWTRQVKWPGPRIHDTSPAASAVRERLGIGYENLFSRFLVSALSVTGVFGYFVLAFAVSASLLSDYIAVNSYGLLYLTALVVFLGGRSAFKSGQRYRNQVSLLLSDLAAKVEPRTVDARSARSEYAIEHPMIGYKKLATESRRAFDMFYESVRCLQDGDNMRALTLYQEAMRREPSLHDVASEILPQMAVDCSSEEEGSVCYWQGLHYEYLVHWNQAATWYQRAAEAYDKIGYKNRESRTRCNLGHVKMQMRDASGMEEFEKAIALNPRNGTAHLNIARTYYSFSYPGDPEYELALDAFANAVRADPVTYTPDVISSLRELGYNWNQEWEEIAERVQSNDTNDT